MPPRSKGSTARAPEVGMLAYVLQTRLEKETFLDVLEASVTVEAP